ncbi:hypothetical protein [Natronomonas halophila]|uniref:hypothetical protein n=1 Tax=Natronomonas halophila TaxID=2747817 RepID=UPI001BACDE6F|nr:hypothetical protein [Natronomonas halophila]
MSERNTSNTVDGITLVTDPEAAYLNERQLVDYRCVSSMRAERYRFPSDPKIIVS